MHLLIPYASALSDASTQVLRDLRLPSLMRLMSMLQAGSADLADEYTLSPPHERALALAHGWQGRDGCWPWAALQAQADGINPDTQPCGLLTPVHWHVGREHVTLADPVALALSTEESQALFDAVQPLFADGPGTFHWGAPLRWYLLHPDLDGLACASIDRAIGRNVDLWLRGDLQAADAPMAGQRWVQRLQSEVQMLLYQHPVNDARLARGALPVNSFWLSGCGPAQAATAAITVDDRLRAPLMAEDWAGWAEAWRALDAEVLPALLARADRSEPVALTLCGERGWQRFDAAPRTLWQRLGQRFKRSEPHRLLEAL